MRLGAEADAEALLPLLRDRVWPFGVVLGLAAIQDGDKKKLLQFEVRHWISNSEDSMWMKQADTGGYMATSAGNTVGNLFYGDKGYMVIKGYNSYATFLGQKREPGPAKSDKGEMELHVTNWLDAIREGRPASSPFVAEINSLFDRHQQ